MTETINVANIE